jgi:hypothetical protein
MENDKCAKDNERKKATRRHTDLEVYQRAFAAAMRIFELTKTFPKEEKYSLIDQIRRSSRSVCANIGEAWRKRRYEAAWVSKLGDRSLGGMDIVRTPRLCVSPSLCLSVSLSLCLILCFH